MQKSAPLYENLKADEMEFSEPKSKKLREDSDYSESEQGESDHSFSQELGSQSLTLGSDEGDHIYVGEDNSADPHHQDLYPIIAADTLPNVPPDKVDIPHFDPSQYENLVATTPLYAGGKITILQAVAQHFIWFTAHPGTSKQALSDILCMQHHEILPSGNLLPDSYNSAMKVIEPYLLQPLTFHACDCIIFRNEYHSLTHCPKCGSSRYKNDMVPVRRFIYLPLGPHLERLFGTSKLSQIVQSHSFVDKPDVMYDIHHSPAWVNAYLPNRVFQGDHRGIALALCTDGVNPFSHLRVSYSMWPIMLTLLNLPRHMRHDFNNILLVGIVPGNGRKEPKDINPYLEIVVDELLQLSTMTLFDSYQKAPFQLKIEVLSHILDYPGIEKVLSVTGAGAYKGCAWCEIKGI